MKFIMALIMVESGGDPNAIGDKGKAVGILQIHSIVVKDVNRIYKTKYTDKDRYDQDKSTQICELYLRHYASTKRLGRVATNEDMAKCWNSGPNWFNKSTKVKARQEVYWQKVKKHL